MKFLPAIACLAAHGAMAGELFDETKAVTLFAFDSVSIPHTANLRLEMRQPRRHSANPVLQRGAPGSPDAGGVQFYGSVIRDGAQRTDIRLSAIYVQP